MVTLTSDYSKYSESYGLAVEHSAHDLKVVGSIPIQSNARWKWCQSHARLMIAGAWLSSLMLQMIDKQLCVGK